MFPASLIQIFVRHKNAATLLMVMMMAVGIVGIQRLNTQFFPDFGIDIISVIDMLLCLVLKRNAHRANI